MSLITRCPACGTMFKVVTDQLKVSQGWVRCGHCADVFDASKHLLPREASIAEPTPIAPKATVDVDNSSPGEAASPAASGSIAFTGDANQNLKAAEPADAADASEAVGPKTERAWPFSRWGSGKRAQADTTPAALSDAVDSAADFDPAGWKEALQKRQLQEDGAASAFLALGQGKSLTSTPSDFVGLAEEAAMADEPPRRPDLMRKATVSDAEFEEELDASQELILEAEKEVSFVRDAERKDLWKRPLVRGMLTGFSLVLALLLGLQWVLQQKDSLAASDPRLGSALQALCGALGCQVQPPRRVESLVIDSSTFNKVAADAYRLSFVLKNTGSVPLEMPALELTLTDTQDQAVVRRVLLPAQFGVDSGVLGARAEVTGVVSLRVSGDGGRPNTSASANASVLPPSAASSLRVAGYRVLAFYP
jgi:predicted Zn finger-like uncharacterized protein